MFYSPCSALDLEMVGFLFPSDFVPLPRYLLWGHFEKTHGMSRLRKPCACAEQVLSIWEQVLWADMLASALSSKCPGVSEALGRFDTILRRELQGIHGSE